MTTLRVTTRIAAPPAACFDLARSVDAHLASAGRTAERAVSGPGGRSVTSGLLSLGDEVTFEARHLGLTRRLTARVTAYDRPAHFRDEQVAGPFAALAHDHQFAPDGDGTVMIDVLRFAAPYGPLGRLAERLVIGSHLRRFLVERGAALRSMAERDAGRCPRR